MGPLYIVHRVCAYSLHAGHTPWSHCVKCKSTVLMIGLHFLSSLFSISLSVVTRLSLSEGKSSLLTSRSRRCRVRWGKMSWLMGIHTLYRRFEYVCMCACVCALFITSSSQRGQIGSHCAHFSCPLLSSSFLLAPFTSRSSESIIFSPSSISLCILLSPSSRSLFV